MMPVFLASGISFSISRFSSTVDPDPHRKTRAAATVRATTQRQTRRRHDVEEAMLRRLSCPGACPAAALSCPLHHRRVVVLAVCNMLKRCLFPQAAASSPARRSMVSFPHLTVFGRGKALRGLLPHLSTGAARSSLESETRLHLAIASLPPPLRAHALSPPSRCMVPAPP
nr:unnamed protein product [Digitaria exilis]